MDIKSVTKVIEDFLFEAGALALEKHDGIECFYKEGQQALTATDLAVSKMAQERLSPFLSLPNHVLIDEESIKKTPSDVLPNSEYQWVLDPIDGTAGYALGRKMWGVSLGLLHNGAPIVGGIYMPAVGYFLIADDKATYKIDVATKQRNSITCSRMPVNSQIFVESYYGSGHAWGDTSFPRKIWMNTPESAVQGAITTILQQSAGTLIAQSYSIWDVAGMLALIRHTGLKAFSMQDGCELTQLRVADFKENWKLTGDWLICHPDNFKDISVALKGE
jgi:fructose-1,6-bisphosphatase/inositol monophosphatase family enzyme